VEVAINELKTIVSSTQLKLFIMDNLTGFDPTVFQIFTYEGKRIGKDYFERFPEKRLQYLSREKIQLYIDKTLSKRKGTDNIYFHVFENEKITHYHTAPEFEPLIF
jgi:hypothetical protein